MENNWKFIDSNGTFELTDPHQNSHLYFPLVNEAGMMSAITPILHGDAKTGQHSFLLPPTSAEDLHNARATRNFWVNAEGFGPWSVAGNSARQISQLFHSESEDRVTLQAGFLWHNVIRQNQTLGLRAEISNFSPHAEDAVELMRVNLVNISDHPIKFIPIAAIPIYARSADNLRDHRHVTSLLHHIECVSHGVRVQPTLSFDERGHHPNHLVYAVLGLENEDVAPIGFYPVEEDFIGEGGFLDWPEAVINPSTNYKLAGTIEEGFEAFGGLRFNDVNLLPGESVSYTLIFAIFPDTLKSKEIIAKYGGHGKFEYWLEKTKAYWQSNLKNLVFQSGDLQFDSWMKWVSIQPTLRRLFGNSFLPDHDYGRGGRGWRDLWQDILALMIMQTGQVTNLLFENFAGVRLDGSNATIIGSHPGEFKADRNNIPRVWMDHGAWPLLTTQLYIHQTGDIDFLMLDQKYFKDHHIERAQAIDVDWDPSQGTNQRTASGELYLGSVLEHLLVQHLVVFYNVGEHNIIKLEGADWNDGLDMAANRGESVAFTAMYANNLQKISQLAAQLQQKNLREIELAVELLPLLDTIQNPINYDSIQEKLQRLKLYLASVRHTVSGKKLSVSISKLTNDLETKANWMINHLRSQEWICDSKGNGWFNGYYNNDGQRLEGEFDSGVRMTLTGQVFMLMGGIATDDQAQTIIKTVDHYLLNETVGGYQLNTNFKEILLNMGRSFGFAFGHKENGAVFSHMAVMYAYALYERNFVKEAHRVLAYLYNQSVDFPASRMYPGIPEYFNSRGRGMYPYLTGSASWFLLTILTQSYGIRGEWGDLLISPKLLREQFDSNGETSVQTWFAGKRFTITYKNPQMLQYGEYQPATATLDGQEIQFSKISNSLCIPRTTINSLNETHQHTLVVQLARKN
jgi:cellobiose phosphorylase